MRINRALRLTLAWLLLSVLLGAFLFSASQSTIQKGIEGSVRQHLSLTLDESHFSSTESRVNDQRALQRIAGKINAELQSLVDSRWYAVHQDCVVRLQQVDDVTIGSTPLAGSISFGLLRNQIERRITLGVSCSPNWWAAAGASVFLGLLFVLIASVLPPPLSKAHRRWINYLLGRGYSGQQAFEIISGYDASVLGMNSEQLHCLEQLHDSDLKNFSRALEVATDARVAALDGRAMDWFLLGLKTDPQELEHALRLARSEDSVMIDLRKNRLSIHGLDVPMSLTPFFYYAWYAMRRQSGSGWIANPASNRPNLEEGSQLAHLMSSNGGHARAINDLEQAGLKARTLDQNRSKIKEDIVSELGEKLAGAYLFESSKHADGVQMAYRLCPEASRIQIIS